MFFKDISFGSSVKDLFGIKSSTVTFKGKDASRMAKNFVAPQYARAGIISEDQAENIESVSDLHREIEKSENLTEIMRLRKKDIHASVKAPEVKTHDNDHNPIGFKNMHHEENSNDIFSTLRSQGIGISKEQEEMIKNKVSQTINYKPRVGIYGKTGVGKSSLCNALFGDYVSEVSDFAACTRDIQDIFLSTGENKGITLVDVPGIGESKERDKEYKELYKRLIPELDAILWVIKADDRAHSSDEEVYKDIVRPLADLKGIPVVFVINQIDKIEPIREWNVEEKKPGEKQIKNIKEKKGKIMEIFDIAPSKVCAVSAVEGYGLSDLIYSVTHHLPKEKKYGFSSRAKKENVSEETKIESESGLWDTIKSFVKETVGAAAIAVAGKVTDYLLKKFKL